MFSLVVTILVIIITIRTVLARPVLLVFAALVFVLFYYVLPKFNPSAPTFGNPDPTQADPPTPTTPIPVRRALPVHEDSR